MLTEGKHTGEFIISEANGTRSRGTGTILSGENLSAGTILGKVTASSKYVRHAIGASDGSEDAVAILFDNVDATDGDVNGAVLVERAAEVRAYDLTYSDGIDASGTIATNNALKTLGIIVR